MDIKNMAAVESIGTCSEIKVQYESMRRVGKMKRRSLKGKSEDKVKEEVI